jgi:hypothetical protein
MSERNYTRLFDVSYKKVELETTFGKLAPPENFVRVGKAFESTKGIITVRMDAQPIEAFWPSRKLVLFPKALEGEDEAPLPPPAPSPVAGQALELRSVPPGSFFRKPRGRVTYLRIGNSINYPFKLEDVVFGVNRNGSVVQMKPGDAVVAGTLDDYLNYDKSE